MFKQTIGRLLQGLSFFLDKLSYITHPDRLADRIDPIICRFLGHEKDDMDDDYCFRCFYARKRHCFRCGEELK